MCAALMFDLFVAVPATGAGGGPFYLVGAWTITGSPAALSVALIAGKVIKPRALPAAAGRAVRTDR